jgi:hypothetical protein
MDGKAVSIMATASLARHRRSFPSSLQKSSESLST